MSFFEIKNLNANLGDFNLRDIDLDIEKGEYATVIGPTGSGKSILLETAAGFHKTQNGSINLDGHDITKLEPDKRNISIVYQDYALFPHMNIFDNIAYGLKKKTNNNKIIAKETNNISSILGIDHLLHRKPNTLSGGEMQRVSIARSLVVKPKMLFLDEPFSALDIKTKENIRKLIKFAMKEYDTTVLHVTHDFDDVWNLASRVVMMKKGSVLQNGEPEEIFNRPSYDFIADFVGTNTLFGRVKDKEDGLTVLDICGFDMYTTDSVQQMKDVRVSIRPEDIIIAKKPLESSARNVIPCKIEDIQRKGHLVWITLSIGDMDLKAVLTPNSCQMLELEKGKQFYAIFKAVNLKILGDNNAESV